MAYRRTERVIARLAARHEAIVAAARALASESGMGAVQIVPVAERAGIAAGHLPEQDAEFAAAAVIGAVIEGLLGPLSGASETAEAQHSAAQALTLFALRALGVVDARARGLVVQAG